MTPLSSGRVLWNGRDIQLFTQQEKHQYRREMTVIFQDSIASLNPKMTIETIIGEPLEIFEPELDKVSKKNKVIEALEQVGLSLDSLQRYPHEFSGGQCQRIAIARAIILKPKIIICDEAVSALDVSIQAQILQLLDKLRKEQGVSLIFISHNLAVIRQICDRVLVLYLGKVMEIAESSSFYQKPRHPYSQALLSAIPIPDPKRERMKKREALFGDPPSPLSPPSGCVFHTRCPKSQTLCESLAPPLRTNEGVSSSFLSFLERVFARVRGLSLSYFFNNVTFFVLFD